MIREGADEQTLGAEEKVCCAPLFDTTDVAEEDMYAICQAFFFKVSRDQNGKPCITITRSCTTSVKCKKSREKPEGPGALVFESDSGQGFDFYDLGSVQI